MDRRNLLKNSLAWGGFAGMEELFSRFSANPV